MLLAKVNMNVVKGVVSVGKSLGLARREFHEFQFISPKIEFWRVPALGPLVYRAW